MAKNKNEQPRADAPAADTSGDAPKAPAAEPEPAPEPEPDKAAPTAEAPAPETPPPGPDPRDAELADLRALVAAHEEREAAQMAEVQGLRDRLQELGEDRDAERAKRIEFSERFAQLRDSFTLEREALEAEIRERDEVMRKMAARVQELEAPPSTAPAEQATTRPAPAAAGCFRAKHRLGLMVGGKRVDVEPGEPIEDTAEELAAQGLRLGEHFEAGE